MEHLGDIINYIAGLGSFGCLFYVVYAMNKQDKEFAKYENSQKNN